MKQARATGDCSKRPLWLALATIVQVVIVGPFCPKATRAFSFSRSSRYHGKASAHDGFEQTAFGFTADGAAIDYRHRDAA